MKKNRGELMTEQVFLKKKILFLKNYHSKHEPQVIKTKVIVHKRKNQVLLKKTALFIEFHCWACGLSSGESELCKNCKYNLQVKSYD
jgi:predicted metal-binding protein